MSGARGSRWLPAPCRSQMAGPSADALTLRLDNIEDSLAAALSLLRSLTNTSSRPRRVRRAAAAAAAAASSTCWSWRPGGNSAAPPVGQADTVAVDDRPVHRDPDACLCSRGCPSTWGCQPSFLCSDPGGVRSPIYLATSGAAWCRCWST